MRPHLRDHRQGFDLGLTEITTATGDGVGIGLAVLRLAPSSRVTLTEEHESAWLLMSGEVEVSVDGSRARWSRASLFDDAPSCAHLSAGTALSLEVGPDREVELTRYTTANRRRFAPTLHAPTAVREEPRGRGQVGGACHRLVRTIFDRTNADPEADLVLGEVVTLPGRWSSYPPHHHAQPELYHYRFGRPEGYGHAEHGEEIFKVRHGDTVLITPPNDHAQAAAPGYAMYYAWAIRHLPGKPYDAPTFDDAHRWVMEPGAEAWSPRRGPPWDLEPR